MMNSFAYSSINTQYNYQIESRNIHNVAYK